MARWPTGRKCRPTGSRLVTCASVKRLLAGFARELCSALRRRLEPPTARTARPPRGGFAARAFHHDFRLEAPLRSPPPPWPALPAGERTASQKPSSSAAARARGARAAGVNHGDGETCLASGRTVRDQPARGKLDSRPLAHFSGQPRHLHYPHLTAGPTGLLCTAANAAPQQSNQRVSHDQPDPGIRR